MCNKMKKIYPVNKEMTLKENIRDILPMMFDDFMQLSDTVINFPMRKNDLHQMRIAGKPLRYTMEIGEYCFGEKFKKCLNDIKDTLDLMGEIHDADVMVPEISLHIQEIRLFNQTIPDTKQRLSTRSLRDAIIQLRSSRREMFTRLASALKQWKLKNYRNEIVSAMR